MQYDIINYKVNACILHASHMKLYVAMHLMIMIWYCWCLWFRIVDVYDFSLQTYLNFTLFDFEKNIGYSFLGVEVVVGKIVYALYML
jgi:hypothetical protein